MAHKVLDQEFNQVHFDVDNIFDSSLPSDTYIASVNRVNIGWDYGLSPIRHQAII